MGYDVEVSILSRHRERSSANDESQVGMSTVLVVCVGNSLVGDDGVGPAVFEALSSVTLPESVRSELLGVGGISLLEQLEGESLLIVVDAVELGSPTGTIHVLDWDDLPGPTGAPISAHDLGIRDALEIGRRVCPERLPLSVRLVGIEGRGFEPFTPMSPDVEAAVEGACDEVIRLVREALER